MDLIQRAAIKKVLTHYETKVAVIVGVVLIFATIGAYYLGSIVGSSTTTSSTTISGGSTTSCVITVTQIGIPTLAALKNNVSAIIVGKVTGFANITVRGDSLSTVFTVFVNQTVKGEVTNGSTILVSQFGKKSCPASNDPLMNVGDQAVLFLYKVPNSTVWGIFAGQQGRFLVQNGKVSSLDVVYPNTFTSIHVQNLALDQFIVQIKKT